MADRPTIYLTNAASVNAARRAGRPPEGRVWSIMARPRPGYGEAGDGTCGHLVPDAFRLSRYRAGSMSLEEYRGHYQSRLRLIRGALFPGKLQAMAVDMDAPSGRKITAHTAQHGDTLICACSRAKAAQGACHRVWAAEALQAAGWDVVLDGTRLEVPHGR